MSFDEEHLDEHHECQAAFELEKKAREDAEHELAVHQVLYNTKLDQALDIIRDLKEHEDPLRPWPSYLKMRIDTLLYPASKPQGSAALTEIRKGVVMTDKKKSNAPSPASKKGDQLWVANDELSDDQRETLNAMIEKADKYPTKEEYFEGIVAESFADTKLPERLTRTAARAKLSDLAYAKKYLAVKK